jgi:hypothetical protein
MTTDGNPKKRLRPTRREYLALKTLCAQAQERLRKFSRRLDLIECACDDALFPWVSAKRIRALARGDIMEP